MGRIIVQVIVVCHTECGYVDNKELIYEKKSFDGVTKGVRNLAAIAKRYEAKITFAVMPEAANYFPKEISNHEIGLHIHSGWVEKKYKNFRWFLGDQYLMEHCKTSNNSAELKNLNFEDQLNLIETGKDYLIDKLKTEPKVFVAGRFSENNDTIKALVQTGFTHDLSASPNPKSNTTSVWSKIPRICMPYHPSSDDYQKKGDLPLLIVPISQFFPFGNVSPEEARYAGISTLKACFMEYYRQNLPLFHIYVHSLCMTDSWFCSVMDELLHFVSKHNVKFIFASQVADFGEVNAKTDLFPYLTRPDGGVIRILTNVKKMKAKLEKQTAAVETPSIYRNENI